MLSRRNIRIKVMQILYSMNRDEELELEDVLKIYRDNVDLSYRLYLFHLYLFTQFTKLATDDYDTRQAKHLPTEADKNFQPILFNNEIIQSLVCNVILGAQFEKFNFEEIKDDDVLKKVYADYVNSEIYTSALQKENISSADTQALMLDAYKFFAKHNFVEESIESSYSSWLDDKSLIIGTMKKTIKRLPDVENFYKDYEPDDETTKEFGEHLLNYTIANDKMLLEMVTPILKNWDPDRVAIIDMILIKMALSEMINFTTIPTKVTLNEFVELAKNYSTDKSKDFINGVLDKLMKKLSQEGKIKKEGRGLFE